MVRNVSNTDVEDIRLKLKQGIYTIEWISADELLKTDKVVKL